MIKILLIAEELSYKLKATSRYKRESRKYSLNNSTYALFAYIISNIAQKIRRA